MLIVIAAILASFWAVTKGGACPPLVSVYVDIEGTDSACCGSLASPCATLSQSLQRASSGATILLQPGLHSLYGKPLSLGGLNINISSAQPSKSSSTILDCGNVTCFEVLCPTPDCSSSLLHLGSFVVQNGNGIDGGCMAVNGQGLSLQGMVFLNCQASLRGGAISMIQTTATITSSTFLSSSVSGLTSGGGAIFASVSSVVASALTINNCSAINSQGGGIFSSKSTFNITNYSNISSCFAMTYENSSSGSEGGGAIYSAFSKFYVALTTIGDSVADNGGCWFDKSSDIYMLLTTFQGCAASVGMASSGGGFYGEYTQSFFFINSEVANCTASQDGGGLLFTFAPNIVITGSYFVGNGVTGNGGGLNSQYSSFHISGSRFVQNQFIGSTYSQGGGIYVLDSVAVVEDSKFIQNGLYNMSQAQFQNGGAISFYVYSATNGTDGSLLLQNCKIIGNMAQSGGGLYTASISDSGAGDFLNLKVTINGTLFSQNAASQIGGAGVVVSPAQFNDCQFLNNTSQNDAGGLSSQVDQFPVTVRSSHFVGNLAVSGNGGGFEIPQGGLTSNYLINCTFLENMAPLGFGGAVYTAGSLSQINSSFFYGNSAGISGGAVEVDGGIASAGNSTSIQAYFSSSVFDSNRSPIGGGAIHGTASAFASFQNCTFTNNNSTVGAAIFLAQFTVFNFYSCHCIGNVALQGGGCILLQDNAKALFYNSQLSNNSGSSEGGALKTTGTSTVTIVKCDVSSNSALVGGGFWAEVESSLIVQNSSFISNQATFQGGAIYQTHHTTSQFAFSHFVSNMAPYGSAVSADSYSNLAASSTSWLANQGNALVLKGSSRASLSACVFSKNAATFSNGGAIWASDMSQLSVSSNSVFAGNYASSGGAIFADSLSSVGLTDAVFNGNVADFGGAMEASGSVHMAVALSQFTGNRASNSGGALSLLGAVSGSISSSLFHDCQAGMDGAGVYLKRTFGSRNSVPRLLCSNLVFNKTVAPSSEGSAFFDSSFYPVLRATCSNCSTVQTSDTIGTVPSIFRFIWPGQQDLTIGKTFRVLASSGDPIVSLQLQVLDSYGKSMPNDNSSLAIVTPTPRISGLLTGTAIMGIITIPTINVLVPGDDLSDITLQVSLTSPSNAFPAITRRIAVGFCQPGTYLDSKNYTCKNCPIGQWCAGGQPSQYCPSGSFSFQPGAFSPANCSVCSGGLQCQNGNGTVLQGFWLDPASVLVRPAVYGCDQSRGCSGFQYMGEIVQQCQAGYEDRVCSKCSGGYYGFLTSCSRCSPIYRTTFFLVAAIVLLIWLLINWLSAMSPAFDIVVVEMQFLSVLGAFNLDYFGGSWIASVFQIFNITLFFPDFLGPECVSQSYTFSERWFFTAALPFVGLLLYVLCFLLSDLACSLLPRQLASLLQRAPRRDPAQARRGLVRSVLNMLDLLYFSVTIRCFQAFHSETYDRLVLSADPTIPWLSPTHVKILPFAVLFTAFYVIGLPLYFLWVLVAGRSQRLLHEKEYLEKYGTLYERYEPELFWWYVPIVWGRRISFSAILVFWSAHPDMQAYISFLVILVLGLTHYFLRPHKSPSFDILFGVLLLAQYLFLLAGTANSYMTDFVAGQPSESVAGTGLVLYMVAVILVVALETNHIWAKFWVRQWAIANGDDDNQFPTKKQPEPPLPHFSLSALFKRTDKGPAGLQAGQDLDPMLEDLQLVPLEEITAWFNPHVLKAFLEFATISELNLLQMVRVAYSYHVPSRGEIRQAGRILDCLPKSLRFSFINELLSDSEMEQITPKSTLDSSLSDKSSTPTSKTSSGSTSLSGGMSIDKLQSAAISANAAATLQKVYGNQRIRELRNITEAAASDKRRAGETLRMLLNPRYVEIVTAWLLFDELEGRVALKELLAKFNQWLLVLPHEPSTLSKLAGGEDPAGPLENRLRLFWRRVHLRLSL